MQKQRCVLLVDAAGEPASHELRKQLSESNLPFEVHHVGKGSLGQPGLAELLSNQQIGTYLYVYTAWDLQKPLLRLAEEAGFSDDEMECRGFGPMSKQVYCSACQEMNEVQQELELFCDFCGIHLTVSDHFSKRLQAYLGYTSIQ
ncbi:hypothetical protein EDM56_20660 [Brevibacillus fluminis]|uniref:Dimethylamine monooxygenase subunit DmmA-like C-terminal domain-containing protein n=1 Tax=Brevibacillus fluminis TaxID=511487 RepID=A0A3M8DB83_9BACL|nr:dimethylamine monooxygenase subunit DmmA family protein [Brevibacillus fluminis]RNB84527.1 hypothetical protein EDM56_20660 [Brevibacillus fluminis]